MMAGPFDAADSIANEEVGEDGSGQPDISTRPA